MQTRIMIVDDEEVTGRLLLYQLQELGYTAVYVQDGVRALQQILIEQPNLILLDVMMPLISGWDVCREIRACSSVPIIMLTGKDADDDVVVGLAAGADDYVTKPFNLAQLQARIEAVLRRAGPRGQWATAGVARHSYAPAMSTGNGLSQARMPQLASATPAPPTILSARVAQVTMARTLEPAPQTTLNLPVSSLPAPISPPTHPALLGPRLYAARQARGLSLYHAAQMCLLRWDYLQAIEQEHWNYIPRPQLHKTMRQYATFLQVDPGPAIREQQQVTPILYYTVIVVAIVLVLLLIVIMMLIHG